jgi:lipopolysaccharide export LptBFGC system permease protein LptF
MRVFILASVALTLMLSLGSILRPVQEYGVGPQQIVHLMGYFLPITLTFVLPMAALFAAALIYGRFASDNELDACRASGINLLTLVYPGLVLAISVAIANLILSFYVMPAFVHRAEKSIRNDAQQIIFRNIQRKGYYALPPENRYQVYADQADLQSGTLLGVIIAEVKDNGIEKIITAEDAKVNFILRHQVNEVQIMAHKTYQISLGENGGFYAERGSLTTEFGSLMSDDIMFKKIDEMKRIKADPMLFYPIEKAARETYAQLIAELLAEDIANKITQSSDNFYRLHSGGNFIRFTATQCVAGDKTVELTGDVVVIDATKEPLRTLQCKRALLLIEGDELAPTLTMELYNARWTQGNVEALTQRHIVRGLVLPKTVTDKFKTDNVLTTVQPASTMSLLKGGSSKRLRDLQGALESKINKTFTKIIVEIHSRLVFGIGCVLMIMIGIGLGIIKKEGHLLIAFGASSIPAAVLIVCIISGKNIAENPGSGMVPGMVLMWSGLVFLLLLTASIYRKLLKN